MPTEGLQDLSILEPQARALPLPICSSSPPPPTALCDRLRARAAARPPGSCPPPPLPCPLSSGNEEGTQGHMNPAPRDSLQSSCTPSSHLIHEPGRVGIGVPTCWMTELRTQDQDLGVQTQRPGPFPQYRDASPSVDFARVRTRSHFYLPDTSSAHMPHCPTEAPTPQLGVPAPFALTPSPGTPPEMRPLLLEAEAEKGGAWPCGLQSRGAMASGGRSVSLPTATQPLSALRSHDDHSHHSHSAL